MSAGYVPFFHVGILVRDIDQAAEDFEALLGLRFEPVRAAPMVGEHTRQVLTYLGLGDEAIDKLMADGAIEGPLERW